MLLSATALVKASFNLYKKNFQTFIRYSIMLVVPMIIAAIVAYGAANTAFELKLLPNNEGAMFGGIGMLLAIFILAGLVSFWFSLAVIRVIGKCYENLPLKSMREEMGDAAPIMWSAILASLIAALAILGGTILLIIPGIIFSLWFAFVVQAVSLDNIRGIEALRASKKLVQGRWWGVLWRLLVPAIIGLIISYATNLPLGIAAEITGSVALNTTAAIVSGIASILITPFMTGAQTILYLELKKHPVTLGEPEPN